MHSKKHPGPLASALALAALAVSLYVGWLVGRFALLDRVNAYEAAPSVLAYVQALLWPLAAGILAAAATNWALRFTIRHTWPPTAPADSDD